MRRRVYLIIIVVLSGIGSLKSAAQPGTIPFILDQLFTRILDTNSDIERLRLNDSIKIIIESYVRSDSVFSYRFNKLRYLGQIDSPDKLLKIITWNLVLRDGSNSYFCYIIRKEGKKTPNKIYTLTGSNKKESAKTDITYNEKDWYGALYYAIQPFKINRTTNYVLLGIDYGSLRLSRKILDILGFAPDGGIVFGNKCLVRGNETKYREVFEYSSESLMTLRVYSPRQIVFDHLVSFAGNIKDNPEYYGAEYRFDAYVFKKGFWTFIQNVDVKNKK